MQLFIVVVAACVVAAEAASCPTLSVVQDFDVSKFVGTWYNQGVLLANLLTQGGGSCVKAEYTLDASTGVVTVVNSKKSILGTAQSIKGTAVLQDPTSTVGVLNVTLDTVVGSQSASMSVLDTDYESFAILYSCQELLGQAIQSGWIMTRTQVLEGEEKEQVEVLITSVMSSIEAEGGPAYKNYNTISQKNC